MRVERRKERRRRQRSVGAWLGERWVTQAQWRGRCRIGWLNWGSLTAYGVYSEAWLREDAQLESGVRSDVLIGSASRVINGRGLPFPLILVLVLSVSFQAWVSSKYLLWPVECDMSRTRWCHVRVS